MFDTTILVVEDQEDLCCAVSRSTSSREGYRVLKAQTGEAGVKLAVEEAPDLVLLDVMLPGLSGIDVCREIRRGIGVPVIFLTAKSDVIDKVVALETGGDDYMVKPFSLPLPAGPHPRAPAPARPGLHARRRPRPLSPGRRRWPTSSGWSPRETAIRSISRPRSARSCAC